MQRSNPSAVMAVATFAYFAAVMQRSSMGIASLDASERFDTSATALSGLAVSQLAVYAIMQIPVGVLLDRFGARALIIFGTVSMVAGQLVVAYSQTLQIAYFGRMLVGLGDAFIFISMVRLIVAWNEPRSVPRKQQLLTSLGQLGQIASATCFAFLLATAGWQNSFSISALVVALAALLAVVYISNEPSHVSHSRNELTIAIAIRQLFENLKFAGTRMSFWVHFTLQSSGSVFALLWGVPYIVQGQGQSMAFASSLLVFQTAIAFVFGFGLGWIASKHPGWRVKVVYAVSISIIFVWLFMAMLPGLAPGWLLVVLVMVISVGGPASMYAMDFSREFIAKDRLGSANGFINVGGFLATFSTMAIAGVVLDVVQKVNKTASPFTPDGFRWAMAAQILVLAIGLIGFKIELRRTRMTHRV